MATKTQTTFGNVVHESLKTGLQMASINCLSLRELGIAAFCSAASLKQLAVNSLSAENKKYVQNQLRKLGIE
uniref:Uncharacterized protein n=1 Tax=Podoviridae sp. ctIKM86 TaxID=2827729 RepID=A0A8S5SN69_9CAUD|nr:MAG TPA: hypothetical protein [Podoviridae sp. ctIKM86]